MRTRFLLLMAPTLLAACAHHKVAPLEAPAAVPVAERMGQTGSTDRPNERWLEARSELDELVEVCAAKRAELVDGVREADRDEGLARAGAVGAYFLGGLARNGGGSPTVGPGPASYHRNYVYGSPAPASAGAPTSAEAGAPFPESMGPTVDPTRGGPIAERADQRALDANTQVHLIDEEIDAAYLHLDAVRASADFTAAHEEIFAEHRDRLDRLCAR